MIAVALVLMLGVPGPSNPSLCRPRAPDCPTPGQEEVWQRVVRPYLATPLWTAGAAYDAGHFLMMPLHAAFFLTDSEWQADFAAQFASYAARGDEPPVAMADRLGRAHYLYLASEFLVEAARYGRPGLIPSGLESSVLAELDYTWNREEQSEQGHRIAGGLSAAIRWKLNDTVRGPRFLRIIDDRDRMTFAAAADLVTYRKLMHENSGPRWLTEIVDAGWAVYKARVEWQSDGGWLFQAGWWDGYQDFTYAGTTDVNATAPKARAHQTEDASHAFRWACWLRSLAAASEGNSERKLFYDRMLTGLGTQFFGRVLIPPGDTFPAFRTNNYMDGTNGLYRWTATGAGAQGKGPYGLSGSLTLGWWGFLGTARSQQLYQGLARQFPLAEDVMMLYNRRRTASPGGGPVSNWAGNGFQQLLVELAACYPVGGELH